MQRPCGGKTRKKSTRGAQVPAWCYKLYLQPIGTAFPTTAPTKKKAACSSCRTNCNLQHTPQKNRGVDPGSPVDKPARPRTLHSVGVVDYVPHPFLGANASNLIDLETYIRARRYTAERRKQTATTTPPEQKQQINTKYTGSFVGRSAIDIEVDVGIGSLLTGFSTLSQLARAGGMVV